MHKTLFFRFPKEDKKHFAGKRKEGKERAPAPLGPDNCQPPGQEGTCATMRPTPKKYCSQDISD